MIEIKRPTRMFDGRGMIAALALTVLSVTTACGTHGGDALPPVNVDAAPDAHYLGALKATVNLATQKLDARYERWFGDVELEQASAAIVAYYDNGAMTNCVAEEGLNFEWEGAIQSVDEPSVFQGHQELTPPATGLTTLVQTNVQARALTEKLHITPPEPLRRTIVACSHKEDKYYPELLNGFSEEDLGELLRPTLRMELGAEWDEKIRSVVDQLDISQESLEECLSDRELPAEFSALNEDATFDDYRGVIESAVDEATVPLKGRRGSADWREAVQLEKSFELAAWECKETTYEQGIKLLTREMDLFESRNASRIAESMTANQDILDLATALGWSPERPIGAVSEPEPAP